MWTLDINDYIVAREPYCNTKIPTQNSLTTRNDRMHAVRTPATPRRTILSTWFRVQAYSCICDMMVDLKKRRSANSRTSRFPSMVSSTAITATAASSATQEDSHHQNATRVIMNIGSKSHAHTTRTPCGRGTNM